jgi:hypothetical protein
VNLVYSAGFDRRFACDHVDDGLRVWSGRNIGQMNDGYISSRNREEGRKEKSRQMHWEKVGVLMFLYRPP